jgi:hypothetical protein
MILKRQKATNTIERSNDSSTLLNDKSVSLHSDRLKVKENCQANHPGYSIA